MSQYIKIQNANRVSNLTHLLPALLLLLFIWGCDQVLKNELPFADELQSELDSARQSLGLVGVSASVIVPGYDPWWGGSGESYAGQPITREMLFDTASAGKILLGPLMVKLAEDGLISLDDPLEVYLPDFPYVEGTITIRQLLNHTSGLPMMTKHPESPFRKPYREIDHARWWTIDEIFTELEAESDFPPGEDWCYTQAGYQIATLIVEAVTGKTVGDAIQTRLLDPLEITGMYLDYAEPVPDGLILAHPWVDVDYDGSFEDVGADSRNWIASLSSIFFYATPEDLASWAHALFTGEVLNQESMAAMLDFYRMDDLEVWAKGLSIYLPPLSVGEYQVRWYSQITGEFDNGWVTYRPGDYMEVTSKLEVK